MIEQISFQFLQEFVFEAARSKNRAFAAEVGLVRILLRRAFDGGRALGRSEGRRHVNRPLAHARGTDKHRDIGAPLGVGVAIATPCANGRIIHPEVD